MIFKCSNSCTTGYERILIDNNNNKNNSYIFHLLLIDQFSINAQKLSQNKHEKPEFSIKDKAPALKTIEKIFCFAKKNNKSLETIQKEKNKCRNLKVRLKFLKHASDRLGHDSTSSSVRTRILKQLLRVGIVRIRFEERERASERETGREREGERERTIY